jgi:hypothetical protein
MKFSKSFLMILAHVTIINCLVAQLPDSRIGELIGNVNSDSLAATLQELTGAKEVLIDGKSVTIASRTLASPGRISALQYLTGRLKNYGYTVVQQPFMKDFAGTNIVAEQPGSDYPKQKYILCAHYDDQPFGATGIAPGADDNGSGVAAIIEAARTLSHYQFKNTIVFAFWDLEEAQTRGSYCYAENAKLDHDSILGVLNVDMIGWDGNNDAQCDLHLVDTARSRQLADTIVYANKTYSIGLNPVIHDPGILSSDHREFIARGYSSVDVMEDYRGDFNPYYHTARDSMKYLNLSYLTKNTQLAIAAIAQLADIQRTSAAVQENAELPLQYALEQNYPNPFNPSTTISFTIPSTSHVSLKIYDVLSREVATLASEEMPAGMSSRQWNASGMPSGMYFCRLQTGSYTAMKRLLLVK